MVMFEVMGKTVRTCMEVMVMELRIGNRKQRASHLFMYGSGPSR